MYITETTEEVRKYFMEVKKLDDIGKIKFLIYVIGLINNNQINSKNEINPSALEDDDLDVFNFETIGYDNTFGESFLHYYVDAYKKQVKNNETILEENGNAIGINYNDVGKKIISQFMNLAFNEKLDLISELFIRIDNETYFNSTILPAPLSLELSGFDIANIIKKLKVRYVNNQHILTFLFYIFFISSSNYIIHRNIIFFTYCINSNCINQICTSFI